MPKDYRVVVLSNTLNGGWKLIDYKTLESVHFFQSTQWADIRKLLGWNIAAIELDLNARSYTVLLLERLLLPASLARIIPSALVPHSFVYSPYALIGEIGNKTEAATICNPETLKIFRNCIHDVCKKHFPSAVFFRWDTPFEKELCSRKLLGSAGFHLAPVTVQAPDTIILDLSLSTDDLLASFKPKTRYNIRLASRKSLIIQESTDIARWYVLYQETQKRQGMGIHAEEYYHSVFKGFNTAKEGSIRLYTAEHEGDFLAGIIVLYHGIYATYLYGASADIKRNYMASHLLQWHAITKAKEDGMMFYDLFGISPDADSRHPFYGLYRFKTGFGGSLIHRAGCWDIPLRTGWYSIARGIEARRAKR